MLTAKQEKYIQGLASGMSQREAYRTAYNAKGMKDSTVDEKASRLLAQDKVRARYDELMGKVREAGEKAAVATAVQVLEELTNIGMGTKRYPNVDMYGREHQNKPGLKDRLKALELLGKHWGIFSENRPGGDGEVRIIDDL